MVMFTSCLPSTLQPTRLRQRTKGFARRSPCSPIQNLMERLYGKPEMLSFNHSLCHSDCSSAHPYDHHEFDDNEDCHWFAIRHSNDFIEQCAATWRRDSRWWALRSHWSQSSWNQARRPCKSWPAHPIHHHAHHHPFVSINFLITTPDVWSRQLANCIWTQHQSWMEQQSQVRTNWTNQHCLSFSLKHNNGLDWFQNY